MNKKINQKIIVLIKIISAIVIATSTFYATKVAAGTVNDYIINNSVKPATEMLQLGRIYNQDSNRNGGINMDFGAGKPTMIIIHEVGVDGGTISGSIDYMVKTQDSAFVHAFVDGSQLITIADKSKKSWGAGAYANSYGIQIEQMRVTTNEAFYSEIASLAKWTADQMKAYNMGPPKLMSSPATPQKNDLSIKPDGNLASHKMISYKYNQTTDHVDPDEYWSRFGYDMNQFCNLVSYYYNSFNLSGMTWQKVSDDNSEVNFGIAYQSDSPVTFEWQYYDISKNKWISMGAKSSSNWSSFKAPHSGQYLIYVKATNAKGDTREYSIGWKVEDFVRLTGMTWQNPTKDNSKVNFGVAYESDSPVTFEWKYYDIRNKKWTVMSDKSSSNWATFNAPSSGQYLIYVKATNAVGSSKEYSIGWTVESSITLTGMTWQNLSSDGSKVNFGVAYQSDTAVDFEWKYYDISNKKWTSIGTKGPSNWSTFTSPHPGEYLIYVKAINKNGSVEEYSIGWTVKAPVNLTGMTWQKLEEDNSEVNFGVAYQSDSPVVFDWLYYDLKYKQWISMGVSSSSNWSSFSAPHDGQYLILVKAKNASGLTKEYSIGWEVKKSVTLTGMTWQNQAIDNSSANIGVAYQSDSPVTFEWQYYDISRKQWVIMSPKSTSNWSSFNGLHTGQYLIDVKAVNASGFIKEYSIGWNVGGGVDLSGTNDAQKAWFNALYVNAQQLARDNDLFPSVMMGQAIAESAWGQSELAKTDNNLFGVKADSSWTGAVVSRLTSENTTVANQTVTGYRTEEEGRAGKPATTFVLANKETAYYIYANFRKYASQAESLRDYVTKIKTTVNGSSYRYQGAWRSNAGSYQNAALALKAGGYATDPDYAINLINRIDKYKLNALD